MSLASSSGARSSTWSPVWRRRSARKARPFSASRTALVAAQTTASTPWRRAIRRKRSIVESARACADAASRPSRNAPSPRRTMSFSRSRTRRSRPSRASTTTMWSEFDPTSIAATFIAPILPLDTSVPACALRPAERRGAMTAMTRHAVLLLVAAALATAGRPARAEDPPREGSPDCLIPAFVDEDDAGMMFAYQDGVRRGLEEANLPRVCLRRPERDDAPGWERLAAKVSAEAPPLVFAFGRRSAARVRAAAFRRGTDRIPCVYVDAALVAGGRPSPADPDPPPPCAVVRAHVTLEAWGKALRDLLPARPQPAALLPWASETKEAAAWRHAAEEAAKVSFRTRKDGAAGADAILDVAPGLGEVLEPFDAVVREAKTLRLPLLSGDRARFRAGAAVVLVPDHALLGRVAAEAGRRIVAGEGDPVPLRLAVRTTRVWVDLDAADAEGLKPPLTFLAGADLLRRVPAAGSTPEAGR